MSPRIAIIPTNAKADLPSCMAIGLERMQNPEAQDIRAWTGCPNHSETGEYKLSDRRTSVKLRCCFIAVGANSGQSQLNIVASLWRRCSTAQLGAQQPSEIRLLPRQKIPRYRIADGWPLLQVVHALPHGRAPDLQYTARLSKVPGPQLIPTRSTWAQNSSTVNKKYRARQAG